MAPVWFSTKTRAAKSRLESSHPLAQKADRFHENADLAFDLTVSEPLVAAPNQLDHQPPDPFMSA
jgi:hypothetical protein